ncbi:MAG TPA: hypothetical protein VGQ36_19255 [Thermoanaerobaculia bacterium]|jgi:hypothetical protein|nr:hypothetical protein [Thermoanaerobaculia bacterium]
MRFGRQRSPSDLATFLLLFLGFSALAVAFWMLTLNWAGLLLPIGYLVGAYSTLRAEVKEIELQDDTLILRTFFRAYPIPRAHMTNVVRTPRGAAIDVLNGNRYYVTPPESDAEVIATALEEWLATSSSTLPSSARNP